MKVSLNWVKQFAAIDLPADELIEKIGAQLGAVEEVTDFGKKYKGIYIVKVAACEKHPNADKLSLCLVDDAGTVKSVKRNEKGLIQVVCGAPNVRAGQLAVWIPPGSAVPATYDKEPFVTEARPIRNKTSHGMLASPQELDLGDNHDGILVLESGKPGDSFAKALMLDDCIVDIENKMFTHRPDCFGIIGVARELAGISGQPFKSPDWYREDASLPSDGRKNVLKLAIKNDIPELVPRFCAVAIKDVKVAPSPAWLQSFLVRSGVRPINNIVDITNWFMLATAQPLHAYDYDKIKTGLLGARLAKAGEQLKLLNGKTITLKDGTPVITDGKRPVGLAGVMGGSETEVDDKTANIILECASFDMNQTRRTAMEYGLFTDAATRFTKNQSPRQNLAVLVKTASDLLQLAGGRVASPVVDDKHFSAKDTKVKVSPGFINSRLGLELGAGQIKRLLENVEFGVEAAKELEITVPFWRTDIEIPEDIVEEVGRLYGYDKLPVVLPRRSLKPAPKNSLLSFKDRLRAVLASGGASEVLTYSFVHGSLMEKTGQDPRQAYEIINALSPDLQYYRLSLTPSLLEKVYPNFRNGYKEFAIYEIGKGHNKKMKEQHEKDLPKEFEMLSLAVTSGHKDAKQNGAPYYQAKAMLDYLAKELGTSFVYKPLAKEEPYPVSKPFDYQRSAQVWDDQAKMPLGMVGEYNQSVINSLKLPKYTAGFEIGIEQLLLAVPEKAAYEPLNRFPEVEQDFCLQAAYDLSYAQLTEFIAVTLAKLCRPHGYNYDCQPLDIYQRERDQKHKQTTWRITLWHPERTLVTEETNKLLDNLAKIAKKELNAERI
jgi:phenylalanyl-tRNA synthetase beta chain